MTRARMNRQNFSAYAALIASPGAIATGFDLPANGDLYVSTDVPLASTTLLLDCESRELGAPASAAGVVHHIGWLERGRHVVKNATAPGNVSLWLRDSIGKLWLIGGIGTVSIVTTLIRQLTMQSQTEAGDASAGWNYTSLDDGGAYNSEGIIQLNEDGRFEITDSAVTSSSFYGVAAGTGLIDPSSFAFAMGGDASSNQIYDNGNVRTANGDKTFVTTIQPGNKRAFGFYGPIVTLEIYDTPSNQWEIFHIFETPRTTALRPSSRTFSAGNILSKWTQKIGKAKRWAYQTVNMMGDGNSLVFRDPEFGTVFDRMRLYAPMLGSDYTRTNTSVDGQTIRQMMGLDGGDIADAHACFVVDKFNIAWIWEVTNAIVAYLDGGMTPSQAAAQAIADLGAYIQLLLDANPWDAFVVPKTIPRQGGRTGQALADMNDALNQADNLMVAQRVALKITVIVDSRAADGYYAFTDWTAAGFIANPDGYYDPAPNAIHQSPPAADWLARKGAAAMATLSATLG